MSKRIILCIDPHESARTTFVAVLSNAGFEVLQASSMEDAESVISAFKVDAVLIDPVLCLGKPTCIGRKLSEVQPESVQVIHTGNPDVAELPCLEKKRILPKPFDPTKLIAEIKHALKIEE